MRYAIYDCSISNVAMVTVVSLHYRCPEGVGMQHCTGFLLFPGQQPVPPGCFLGGPAGPLATGGSGTPMEQCGVSLERNLTSCNYANMASCDGHVIIPRGPDISGCWAESM